jgi:acyl-CoA synthetase (AMP-forming)/AMP-acid ligase II
VTHAFVVPRAGYRPDAEEIVGFCRKRLAPYKYPHLIELRESLPLAAAGKVLKRDLI